MGSESTNEPSAGSRMGPYRIVRRMAVGGMSEVFLAHDHAKGLDVVLKIPLPASRGEAALAAFEHEADVTKQLAHVNLVRTLDFVREQGRVALVLELVDGVTLDALLDATRDTPLRADVALGVVVEILQGLGAAHEAKDANGAPLRLVHRDVNPHNVLVSRAGEVKLADFGIARSRVQGARTRTGTIKGTLRYLAPEQATGSDVDARTDLYAVALVAFELLTGSAYAEGESEIELLRAAENPTLRELPADVAVGVEVRRALAAALARFPEERPASATALAKQLSPFAASRERTRSELARRMRDAFPVAEAPSREPEAPLPEARRPPSRWLVPAALGLGTLVSVGVAMQSMPTMPVPAPSTARAPARANKPSEPATVVAESPTPSAAVAVAPVVEAPTARPRLVTPPSTPAPSQSEAAPAATPTVTPPAPPTNVEPAAPTLDRDSVRRQMASANEAIRRARERGDDVTAAQALSRSALEAYGEGRYAESSATLARIVGMLSRP